MKATLLFVPLAVLLALSAAPLPGALGDNEIGYCANLAEGPTTTVNWCGLLGSIFGLIPSTAGAAVGGIFNIMAQFGSENPNEYMSELGQCVNAMINEAIEESQYAICLEELENIMDRMKLLVQNFEALTPENSEQVIDTDIQGNIA